MYVEYFIRVSCKVCEFTLPTQHKLHPKKIIFPKIKDVFSAFKLCNYHKLKIVIIGQDPYHNINQAHGLAFSTKSKKLPPTLVNIFKEIETRGIIRAGKTENEINKNIYDLAFEMFKIKKYWHKRIVRSGPNTLFPYDENPKNLIK